MHRRFILSLTSLGCLAFALVFVLVFDAVAALSNATADSEKPSDIHFEKRVLASGLDNPWEMVWGPDQRLWVTERSGKRVTRINPADGSKQVAVTIDEAYAEGSQDGVLGLALHPDFAKGSSFVFVSFITQVVPEESIEAVPRAKIRRYRFDEKTQTLVEPFDIITNLPASTDHNSGRLLISPDQKIIYSIGDGGANQLKNYCVPNPAQKLPTLAQMQEHEYAAYQGKILRINLDGSVPEDNPLLNNDVRSHVYSYGHRNPQGLAYGPTGLLYSSEHGPKTDDEINLIESGKNYGWPYVAGYQDDQAYVYANWSASNPVPCADLKFSNFVIPPSVPVKKESDWQSHDFRPPLKTLSTVPSDFNFQKPDCGNICWPSIAASGLEVYSAHPEAAIDGWSNSILVTGLKRGSLYRLPLAADGKTVVAEPERILHTNNRYRDVVIAPDQKTFFVSTDNDGQTEGLDGKPTEKLENPGSILEFKHVPPTSK